jgi:hypothetical protein
MRRKPIRIIPLLIGIAGLRIILAANGSIWVYQEKRMGDNLFIQARMKRDHFDKLLI